MHMQDVYFSRALIQAVCSTPADMWTKNSRWIVMTDRTKLPHLVDVTHSAAVHEPMYGHHVCLYDVGECGCQDSATRFGCALMSTDLSVHYMGSYRLFPLVPTFCAIWRLRDCPLVSASVQRLMTFQPQTLCPFVGQPARKLAGPPTPPTRSYDVLNFTSGKAV